jgi:hypothetical protein
MNSMARYPVKIHVKQYGGKKQSLIEEYMSRLDAANKIEAYLNQQMKDQANRTFNYYEIAMAIGLNEKVVRDVLFYYDGGSGGITVFND